MRTIFWVPVSVLASLSAFGQTPAPRLEFEVASVKPSVPPAMGQAPNMGVHIDGAQVHYTYFSLRDLTRIAYRVKTYQVVGPDFLAEEHFDISAKVPEGVQREQFPDMLQSLLADRFGLKFHRETREFPVYALVVDKGGPKLKESALEADATPGTFDVSVSQGRGDATISLGRGANFTIAENSFEAKKLTMAMLADMLARFVDRPVVDQTGLTGTYDLKLEFTREDFMAMRIRMAMSAGVTLPPEAMHLLDGASDQPLFNAVQAYGLRMERRKVPLEVLVVDHAEKTPTAN